MKRALSDLVSLDEPDKNREEHGGRGGFRVLSEVLHSRVVRVLPERKNKPRLAHEPNKTEETNRNAKLCCDSGLFWAD